MANKKLLSDLIFPQYRWYCVGSLPFNDPEEAVSFILSRPYILPFWPELPRRGVEEVMLYRSDRAFDTRWNGYDECEASGIFCIRRRLEAQRRKLPIVKCQLIGPLTALAYGRKVSELTGNLLDEACRVCLRQIEWQAQFLSSVADNFLFVIDEPGLCHNSLLPASQRSLVKDALSFLFVAVQERGYFLGLHSCDCFELGLLQLPVDLLSFDALAHRPSAIVGSSAAFLWREALRSGLVVVPGVFPSVLADGFEDTRADGLSLHQEFVKAFSDSANYALPILLSANCGHSSASLDWIEELYRE